MQITCPSGLAGEIRKLKVKEENLLADVKKMRSGVGLNDVLRSIWTATHDSGPYKLDDGEPPDFNKVLMGDHFYATVYMRVASIGPEYAFKTQCTNQFCRQPFEWELDLTKLPVQKLSDESRKIFTTDNRFEAVVPSTGTKVWFKLLLSDAQQRFNKARREQAHRMATMAMRMQLIEVEGVDKRKLNDWIDDLDTDDASALREAFDAAGCGIETTIEVECPSCDQIFEIELPLGGRDFFSRRKVTKAMTDGSVPSPT